MHELRSMNSLCPPGTTTRGLGFLKWSLALVSAFWLLVVLVWALFEKDLWEEPWEFIFIPVRWGLYGSGVILALVALRQVMPDGENRLSAAAALLLSAAGLVLLFAGCRFLSQDVRFLISKAHYERRLEEILTGKVTRCADVAGIEFGPPDRVAFYWKRGVTDNWVGLVYDPSGEVLQAREFRRDWSNWSDPKLEKVRDLFGGAMYNARHLTGPWYICWFT
jgi:hypothetical protein